MPGAPGALAGGPTQAAPGVRGEEEQWAREIGAQLRRMADDLDALYERRVSAGGRGRRQVGLPAGEGAAGGPARCAAAAALRGGVAPGTGKWEGRRGRGAAEGPARRLARPGLGLGLPGALRRARARGRGD